jgi:hypothetical protein
MIAIVAAHGNEIAIGVAQHVAVADLRPCPRRLDFEERLVDHLCRAANVEGTHGQLRARLTDRLGGDDADSLADVDRRTARQVTAVAGAQMPVWVSQVSTERMRNSWILRPRYLHVFFGRSSRPAGRSLRRCG